jgi:hypothetical protein
MISILPVNINKVKVFQGFKFFIIKFLDINDSIQWAIFFHKYVNICFIWNIRNMNFGVHQ